VVDPMSWHATETGLMIFVADDESPRFKCTVIVGHEGTENRYCNTPFHDEGQFVRHVARCAREHEVEIMQAAPSQRLPAFYGPEAGIPDVEAWLARQDAAGESNAAKVIAKRKKM
jgi:hypothetical protein